MLQESWFRTLIGFYSFPPLFITFSKLHYMKTRRMNEIYALCCWPLILMQLNELKFAFFTTVYLEGISYKRYWIILNPSISDKLMYWSVTLPVNYFQLHQLDFERSNEIIICSEIYHFVSYVHVDLTQCFLRMLTLRMWIIYLALI